MDRLHFARWIVVVAIALLLAACDNSPPLEYTTAREPATIQGTFYSESPDDITFPVKVLFAIDCSGSMGNPDMNDGAGSDPSNQRFLAAQQFIDEYNDFTNVSFNVLLWHADVFRQTPSGFTKDPDELAAVFNGVINTSLTDYVGTVNQINSEIEEDIFETNDHESSVRTKYIVIFFSDGLDNIAGITEPRYAEILEGIRDIREMVYDNGVGGFNFHTFLLSGLFDPDNPTDAEALEDCENLLSAMADAGDGRYTMFETAETIDFINIVDLRLTVEYQIKFMIAYNMNVLPGKDTLLVDSDGDGLSDEVEITPANSWWPATNPNIADSDGDGLSDYFELKVSTPGNMMEPNLPDSPCETVLDGLFPDTDMDGLNDCEEYVKGTNRFHPDTDYDGIPDHIEFVSGTNPLENQITNDSDFDGNVDWYEVQTHTNVMTNDPKIHERYSYYYDITDMGIEPRLMPNGQYSNVRRFDFSINNISIMDTDGSYIEVEVVDPDTGDVVLDPETGDPVTEPETVLNPGENVVRLFIAQVPQDMPNAQPIFRTCDIIFNFRSDEREYTVIPADLQLLE